MLARRGIVCALLCVASLPASAADGPIYTGLQPDRFMKNWLILKPIPVTRSESAQLNAFEKDAIAVQAMPVPAPKPL